jgi:PAS domain S-box-containing protein
VGRRPLASAHRVARATAPDAEARLALLELMLASDAPAACAERALEWLGAHAGVRQAACLLVDDEQRRLVYLAGYRVDPQVLSGLAVDLENREHPLVRPLRASQPAVLQPSATDTPRVAAAFGPAALLALPLLGRDVREPAPIGLLVVRPAFARNREVSWLGEVLGNALFQLRASFALRESERRVRREQMLLYSVIDSIPDPVLLTDPEGRIVVANKRAEALLATTDDESEGRRRAVALNNMLFSSALGRSAAGAAGPTAREVLLVDPSDGSDLLYELMSTTSGTSREGTGIVSILRNVTDLRLATREIEENYRRLRRAESEVRAERDRLALVIDSVADPIIVTDPAGNIVLMNDPADRLFTVAEGASAGVVQRVRANDANFTSFVSNLFLRPEDEMYRGGVTLVDPASGATVPVEAVSGKIRSGGGEVTGIVTILHDRREALEKEALYEELKRVSAGLEQKVKEATAELVRQNELLLRQAIQLEQASNLKSQFLANVSHELRTPLNAILGYTSLLLKGVPGRPTEKQRSALARIESNGRNLLSLINDVLDIARIEAGKMPVKHEEFDLPALVAEVIRELEPLIERSRLVVTTELDRGLPIVHSDRQKVKQILLNFITNALKFTPQGSVSIACTHLPASGEVAVAVADTGIGIAPADHARIFEDFSQADAATREHTGAGLGLSICRRLATVLRGRITLESKPGHGSTFTLLLPVEAKGDAREPQA